MNPVSNQNKPSDRRYLKLLLLLLAIAFLLRIFLVIFPQVIYSDGIEYIRGAKQILSGNWKGSKAPPVYPVLIVLASRWTPNFELAGIWVSVIFGTLAVIPVYYLGKRIFNEKVGTLSALFAVVHPFLYLSSGAVLTEAVYHFLLPTAVLFGWEAFRGGRLLNILLFSFSTTLAYLTRPEAMGYLFVFAFWVLFIPPPQERRPGLKRVGIACLAILCFLVFSFPYLRLLREETGKWEISKKFSISVGSLSDEGRTPIESFTRTKKITLVSFVKEPLTVLKRVVFGWFQALYMFSRGFHPLLFLLAVLGFVWSMRGPPSKKGSLYLLSYFIFYFGLLLPFFWIVRRYTSLISTLALPWASLGFIGLTEWITPRLKEGRWKRTFPALFLLFVLVVIFIQGRVIRRDHRLMQKEAGLWMKDHLARESRIMSRLPQEAFYAEVDWVRMPEKSYEEILQLARSHHIHYIIVDERVMLYVPNFLEKAKDKRELQEVYGLRREGRWVTGFKLIAPPKERESLSARGFQDGGEKASNGCLSLRSIVFKEEEPDKQKEVFWNWQFKGNPDGEGLIYLYKEGGQVVGHFADTPKRFSVEGKEVLGSLSLDMMVHPGYRGGMFQQMGRYAVERTKEKGFAFLTSYPIREWSIKSLRRIGWRDFFKLPVLVYPLRFRGIVNRSIHFYPLSLLIGGIVRIFYFISIFPWSKKAKGEIEVDPLTRLDDAFDRFWQKASSLHPVMGVRDRAFMNWRYFQHPVRTYTIYRAMKEGEMQGYIVLRKVDLLKFNSAVIVDLLALEENALRMLVEKGIEYSRKEDADLLGCIVPRHHLYFKILRRRGFLPSFKSFLFMVYPLIEKGIPLTPEGWYVNWGDSDVV